MVSTIRVAGLAVGTALLLTNCSSDGNDGQPIVGSGNVVEEPRPVAPFSSVALSGMGTVFIRQGGTPSLTVRAEDNVIRFLRTEVLGGTLTILGDPGVNLNPTRPIEFDVVVSDLTAITLDGIGRIEGANLVIDHLAIFASGLGDIELHAINLSDLDVRMDGIGNVRLSGSVDTQIISSTGLGMFDAPGLDSRVAEVTTAGFGSATVRVRERLTVTIGGSGNVNYIGNAKIDLTDNGLGELIHLTPR